jgi:subtilisin family serine protease
MLGDSGKLALGLKAPHGFALYPEQAAQPTPERHPIESVPGGRRPTVAVVDTGIADHEWFRSAVADDPIVVDGTTQGWSGPRPQVTDARYTWHGTFVAGLVRQMAPDARILSVQLTREAGDNGGVADGQILEALRWLSDRTAADPVPDFVDVICLAIGYREDPPTDYTKEVENVIRGLCGRGVLVVTAAGNRTPPLGIPGRAEMAGKDQPPDDRPVFPAALAASNPVDGLPIVAVGATKLDGSRAPFSPDEPWVTHREIGCDVISTVPIVDPLVDPWWSDLIAKVTDDERVESFSRGFAHGSGTSFAAAVFAGRLAGAMLDDSGAATGLADTGRAAAIERAKRALAAADQRA